MVGTAPIKKIKASGGISASIFKNKSTYGGKEKEYFSVKLEKQYKDDKGNWKSTSSFQANELPKVEAVSNEAYKYIFLKENEPTASPAEGDSPS